MINSTLEILGVYLFYTKICILQSRFSIIFFAKLLVQYLLKKSRNSIYILTTFLLTLIFRPALFSGTKHRRDLPLGSKIMKIFIDFWASIYHASLSKYRQIWVIFKRFYRRGGQFKVSSLSPLSPADNLMEMGEYFKKVAPHL